MVERARRILRETGEGEAAVAAELAGHTGRYRISAAPVWLQAVLVPAVAAFHAAFPEVELKAPRRVLAHARCGRQVFASPQFVVRTRIAPHSGPGRGPSRVRRQGEDAMRTGLAIAVLASAVALAACTRTLAPPTPGEQARETHAAIVSGANTLLMGDRLGHFATDDAVERTRTTCRGETCATGFISLTGASRYGLEDSELTLLRARRGVALGREERSGTDRDHET